MPAGADPPAFQTSILLLGQELISSSHLDLLSIKVSCSFLRQIAAGGRAAMTS